MVSVETVTSTEAFLALHDEWNALLQRSNSDCVFLTHEWVSSWWKHLRERRRLHVVTLREDGRLIGILPVALRNAEFSRMTPRVLEFLASGVIGSDYLDVIADRDRQSEVLEALAYYLSAAGLTLRFTQLRRESCLAARLAARLASDDWTVSEASINVCPFVPLANHTWATYLAALGSSQRYNFQRRLRNLEKLEGYRFEPDTSLDVIIELHKKRWQEKGDASEAFHSEDVIAFHREFVDLARKQGWLRLLSIWIKDQPAAALYGLRYGSTFYFYQSGFDAAFTKLSVGLVMMGLAIKTAVDEGAEEYDLLHGREEYKFHWTRETRELGRIELFPPNARGAFFRRCVAFNRAARQMVRRMLLPV